MLIVDFRVESPHLANALEQAPETTVTYEAGYRTADGFTLLVWAEGGEMERFETGLAADPTVEHYSKIAEVGDRLLFRVRYSERGEEVSMTPLWSDLNISLLDAVLTPDGWEMQMRMPDRSALTQFRETCARNGLEFHLNSVYEEEDARSRADSQLTGSQRATLRAAHRLGYFEIPRGASLAEVANHCDISSQAASERLRRGTATLIEATIETEYKNT